jgi:peroxiredoxin
MAQLRHDHSEFKRLNTEIVMIVPNGSYMIEKHIKQHHPPHPILSDKGSKVAEQYSQVKKFYIAGTPTVILVDKGGKILYAKYYESLIDEPDNQEILDFLTSLE